MDLRVETRFKNNVLYLALERQFRGMVKHGDGGVLGVAAECIGIPAGALSGYLNLRKSPYIYQHPSQAGHNKVAPAARKIADVLGEPFEVLFPVTLYKLRFPRVAVREYDSGQVLLSLSELSRQERLVAGPDEEDLTEARREALEAALVTLRPLEEKVLRLRYGLDGGEPAKLQEIGDELGVTKETVRQIEARAFKKMWHPDRSKALRRFIEK